MSTSAACSPAVTRCGLARKPTAPSARSMPPMRRPVRRVKDARYASCGRVDEGDHREGNTSGERASNADQRSPTHRRDQDDEAGHPLDDRQDRLPPLDLRRTCGWHCRVHPWPAAALAGPQLALAQHAHLPSRRGPRRRDPRSPTMVPWHLLPWHSSCAALRRPGPRRETGGSAWARCPVRRPPRLGAALRGSRWELPDS